MFDIDIFERHYGTVPAAMVASLSDDALESYLWHFSFDMIKRKDARTLGRFLLGVVCDEIKRRQSDGAMESHSFDIPELPLDELASALRLSNLITYGEVPESMARLFDHLHTHFIDQAVNRLSEK